MDKPPEKQSRFAKRLARIKSAREIPPTPVKRAIALAFGAIIALGALYLGLV
jgi:cell division septal protein FtsQ